MQIRKNLASFIVMMLVVGLFMPLASAADELGLTADAAILLDTTSGKVLYEKNADKQEYPASMTKMLTCILALEQGNPATNVVVSSNAADVECTRLYPGEVLKLQDDLYQMMLVSDNGCALAVGEAIGGTISNFSNIMNAKAKEIGAVHSHFVNPNGMPDPEHYSTARDMATIAAYGMKMPQFRQIVGTKSRTMYYISPAGHTEYCENTNELLYDYAGCVGGKTGWTNAARGCLMAAADRNGHELIAVVMHASDEDTRFSDAASLLDYGFNHLE